MGMSNSKKDIGEGHVPTHNHDHVPTHNHDHGHGGHSHTHGHSHAHGGLELDQSKWNESADWYEKKPDVEQSVKFYVNLIKEQPWYKPGFTMLDFGCGPGLALLKLGTDLQKGTGYDLSPAMVRRATEKILASGLADVIEVKQLKSEDGADLKGESVDLVLCAYVLHHVAGGESAKRRVFDRLCAAATPGGHVMICEFQSEFSEAKLKSWMGENRVEIQLSRNYQMKLSADRVYECIIAIGAKAK